MLDEFDWKKATFENTKAISQLIVSQKQTIESIEKLAENEAKLDEIIIGHNGIKRDILELRKDTQKEITRVQEQEKKLKLVFWVMENKKVFFALLVSSYMLTFYEVRTAIGIHLEPIVKTVLKL